MSNDEQDLAIGKMVRKYGEAKKAWTAASGEAKELAEIMQNVAGLLSVSPDLVEVERENVCLLRQGEPQRIGFEYLSLEKLRTITDTAREAKTTMDTLWSQLSELGMLPRRPSR